MIDFLKMIVFGLLAVSIFFILLQSKDIEESMQDNIIITYYKKENNTIKDRLITLAKSKIGSPYVYAKTGPDSFDCSGFVYYLFHAYNMDIPRTSLNQSKIGEKISRDQIQKGDILFFDTSGKGHINHSGVYLGGNEFIHASSGKANSVTISSLNAWYKDKFRWGIRKIK